LILSGYFIYCNIKDKTYKPLLNSLAVLAIAGIFAIGANANLLATAEYASFSTRGKRVKFQTDGSKPLQAMTKDYITEYSYGLAESFNLIAPRLLCQIMSHWVKTKYEFMLGQESLKQPIM
jgi:hypothetical protein